MSPVLTESSSVVPPAFSTALRGSVYSTSSTPSVARKATFLPLRDVVIGNLQSLCVRCLGDPVPGFRGRKRFPDAPVDPFAAQPRPADRTDEPEDLQREHAAAGDPVGAAHAQHQQHREVDQYA